MNSPINFYVVESDKIVFISFELSRELSPSDLASINPPDPIKNKFSSKAIILSGRGPIWLYGYLIHYYHPTKAVAVYDPRFDAGIVVESHSSEYKIGDLIKIEIER